MDKSMENLQDKHDALMRASGCPTYGDLSKMNKELMEGVRRIYKTRMLLPDNRERQKADREIAKWVAP